MLVLIDIENEGEQFCYLYDQVNGLFFCAGKIDLLLQKDVQLPFRGYSSSVWVI